MTNTLFNRLGRTRHIHLVGIGGIGMSGIAELLLNLGFKVSGSDIKRSSITERLSALGGIIFYEHKRENIEGADVVVFSSAIREDNPELLAAKERFIPIIPRAEMLAELMRLKFGIAVAGAHGKTTTTCMIGFVLTKAGLDPTVVVGGRLRLWGGGNARLGKGDIMVAEADESDGSFMLLTPAISIITNIDREHLDHYGHMDRLRGAFVDFANKTPFYGLNVLCFDDPEVQYILPSIKKRYITYGTSGQAEVKAVNIRTDGLRVIFDCQYMDISWKDISVGMPGRHNVLNALATICVALELQIPFDHIRDGLKDLGGLMRRFQIVTEKRGITVIDDYAHHPTEIQATLRTVKECWPHRRIIACFQPHRFTRLKDLYERFVISFNNADILILTPLYSAGERPIDGVDSQWLYQGIREHGHREVYLSSDMEEALNFLKKALNRGDIVITLGAGDIYKLGRRLSEEI